MIAIDLGSNTIRFIEYDGQRWGKSFEKIVRTAESLHQTSEIGVNALNRIIEAINESKTVFDFTNQPVIAYTTAAMRMAKNNEQVLEKIQLDTGVAFNIIDGEKEGKLTLLAVKNRLDILNIPSDRFILSDIGGGSTELVIVDGNRTHLISIPVGIVTMSEKAEDEGELSRLLDELKDQIRHYVSSLQLKNEIERFVLTAGTPTTIAAYLHGMDYNTYDPAKINGIRLTVDECRRAYQELMSMDENKRSHYVGVGREILIATGIRIVESLFEALNLSESVVIDDGLREGIALEFYT